jgi:hypothetical protein
VAKRACIFCSQTPVTREHLFPNWMQKELANHPRWKISPTKLQGREGEHGAKQWIRNKPLGMIIRCVCRSCNTGWMSDIEGAAKPILLSMVRGAEYVELDTVAQENIARWACLKAVIGAYVFSKPHPVPNEWLQHLFHKHSAPDDWHVFTTRYIGRLGQVADLQRFSLREPTSGATFPTRAEDQGVLMSLIVGYFAIKALAIRSPISLPLKTNILRVWPASGLTLLWPPRVQVTDERLKAFLRMWADPASPSHLPPI